MGPTPTCAGTLALHTSLHPKLSPCCPRGQARADAAALPAFYGPFDGVFFHNSLGNTFQPYESLRAAALALRPGGKLVLAHAGGRGAASKV
jgi:hypothetical protein